VAEWAREVSCVIRDPGGELTHLGGVDPGGSHWFISVGQAIRDIEMRKEFFFVTVRDQQAVITVVKVGGKKRLATALDDGVSLNRLPQCAD
jgi:hypothetical protein